VPDFIDAKRMGREIFTVILPRAHPLKTSKRTAVALADLVSFPFVSLWAERNCEPNMAAAKAFYMTIAVALGIAMNFAAINPIRALYWCAVLNGIVFRAGDGDDDADQQQRTHHVPRPLGLKSAAVAAHLI
jgi:hypothetical protein